MHPGEFNMAPGGLGKSFTPRFTKLLIQWVTVLVIKDQKVKPTDISQGSSWGGPDKNFGKHSVVGYYYM